MLSKVKREPKNDWHSANKSQKKTGDEGKIPFGGKTIPRKVNTYTRKERIPETEVNNSDIEKQLEITKENLEKALLKLSENNDGLNQILQNQSKTDKVFRMFLTSCKRLTVKRNVKKEMKALEKKHQDLLNEIEDTSSEFSWHSRVLKEEEENPVADHQHVLFLKQLLQDLFQKEDKLNNIADDIEASIAKRRKLLLTKKQPRNSKARKDFLKHLCALVMFLSSNENQKTMIEKFKQQKELQNVLFNLKKQLVLEYNKREKIFIQENVNLKKQVDKLLENAKTLSTRKEELIIAHANEIESMKKEQENQQLKTAERFEQEKSQLETKTNVRWLLKFVKVYADKVKHQEIADKNAKILKKENKKYKAEVDALKIQLKESQDKLQKSLDVQNHLVDCNEENARLNKRMSRQKKEFTRKEQEYTEKIQRLEKELELQKHDVTRLDDELTAKALDCYRMQAQLNKARNANNANQKKSKLLNERVREKSKGLETMKEKEEKDANEKDQLLQKLKSLEEQLSEKEEDLQQKKSDKKLAPHSVEQIPGEGKVNKTIVKKSQMKSGTSDRQQNAVIAQEKTVLGHGPTGNCKQQETALKEKIKSSNPTVKGNVLKGQKNSNCADRSEIKQLKKKSKKLASKETEPSCTRSDVAKQILEQQDSKGKVEQQPLKDSVSKEPEKSQSASEIDRAKEIPKQQDSKAEVEEQPLKNSVSKKPGKSESASEIDRAKEIPKQQDSKAEVEEQPLKNSVSKKPEKSESASEIERAKEIPRQESSDIESTEEKPRECQQTSTEDTDALKELDKAQIDPSKEQVQYSQLDLIRQRLVDIKSILLPLNKELKLAIIEQIEKLTNGSEEYARELNIRLSEEINNGDSNLLEEQKKSTDADSVHNVNTPVWKKKKKKKSNSRKGKAKKTQKHQGSTKAESTRVQESKETAPTAVESNVQNVTDISKERNVNEKIFSLDELKDIFNNEQRLEEFHRELKTRYGILKSFDPRNLEKAELESANILAILKAENDSTIVGSFESLEKHLLSSYESLMISQDKLIEIGKNMLQLNVLDKISEYKQQEILQLTCDTKEEFNLRVEQIRELTYFVQEHTKLVQEIESEEGIHEKVAKKSAPDDILRNLSAKKLEIVKEIEDIQSDQQLLRQIIQQLVKRMREYESESQQLQQLNEVEIKVKRIVSALHKDFDDKLEVYKQAKENMRVFYANVSEVNRTVQQLVEKVSSDARAFLPTPNPSLATSSNDVSVVPPGDDLKSVGSDANDVKSCKVDGDKISDELTL